ncbi:MAG: hypothetical protein LBP63_05850 [Prevotellaceae bacterium]|jgi:hypothetical protein|nr:hypothetical protein [Prevotellaceae bacterium]
MNKLFYKFTITLSVVCIFCQCSNNSEEKNIENGINILSASELFLPIIDDSYIYPVVPGTDAWENLGSIEDIYEVSQLPDRVLKSISTLGLIRSILDIPGLDGFYLASSNSSPIGTLYRIFAHYNSVSELEKRKDSGNALISFYNAVNIDGLNSSSVGERMLLSIQHTALEILFTKPAILQQFDLRQKKQLITSLLARHNQIAQVQYEGFIVNGTITVIAWILYNSKYEPIVQYYGNNAIAEYFDVRTDQTDDIIEFANDFIK